MTNINNKESAAVWLLPVVRVASALAVLQLILHIVAWARSADPRLLAPHGVALLHDLLILGVATLVASACFRFLSPHYRRAGDIVSVLVIAVVGCLLSVYPQMLREHLAFPVNVFNSSSDASIVVLVEYLGIGRLWPVLAAVGVVGLALRWAPKPMRHSRLMYAIALLTFVAGALTLPKSPNPWVVSVVQSLSSIASSKQREVPSLVSPPARTAAVASSGFSLDVPHDAAAPAHVFLIVLEGVTAADFEREFLKKANGFYAAHRDRALYFSRYHATHLDSYTSLIAMLTGIQVPYRAYADDKLYSAVNDAGNLTRLFRKTGFHTSFISTYQHQPYVPVRTDWDRVLDRTGLPSLDGWVSLGANRMEAATEDRAALSTLVDLAVAHDKTFILHELVYGHSTEWRATMGQTQLDYYDKYLRELTAAVDGRGLSGKSLFVIVSDHGDRALSSDADNYRVPLLIVGPNVAAANDVGFRSHLDLPEIVLKVMGRQELPAARLSTFLVGSAERWVYGQMWPDGSHLFIDDAEGAVKARRGVPDAAAVQRSFQSMLNDFAVAFGPR